MKNGFLILLFVSSGISAQELKLKNNAGGIMSMGARSTFSFFNDDDRGNVGTGVGGQFRLQVANRVNTEWFFDYITGDEGDYAHRTDYHIGWSVMYYLPTPVYRQARRQAGALKSENATPKVQPYVLAGHCFDYSKLSQNGNVDNSAHRWSSAVQAGLGTHFNLSPRFDISTTAQYMLHLGKHLHSEVEEGIVSFEKEKGGALEGHLLLTVSLSYKIADLW